MSADKKLTILLYSEDQGLIELVKKIYEDHHVHSLNMMLQAFDFIKDNHVDALLFDTFQIEPFSGINENDLDVLLYYASSDESQNKNMVFLPIDSEIEGKNKATEIYSSLFDKYVFLLSPVTPQTLEFDSIKVSGPMQDLSDIISSLDLAFDKLDKKIETLNAKNSQDKKTVVKDNSAPLQEADTTLVSGEKSEWEEEVTTVSGFDEDEDNTATTVSGFEEEEDDTVTTLSGAPAEKEQVTTVSGYEEEEDDTVTTLSGAPAEKEQVTTVSGYEEEEDDTVTTLSGAPAEKDNFKQIITGGKADARDDKDEKYVIKNSETKEKTTPDLAQKDINMRNNKGMTPVMILARMGQVEKVKELLNMGAKTDLLSHQGKTLLHYACRGTNDLEFISDLVEIYDLKPTKRDSKGKDPLFDAVEGDNDQLIDYLVHHGARLEVKYDGEGILHVALKKNAYNCFRKLLLEGANLTSKNNKGEDVITFCKKKKNLKALKIIAEVSKAKQESVA